MYEELIPARIIPSLEMAKVLSLGTLLLYKFPSNPFSILKDGMFGDLIKDFNDFFLGYFWV